MLELLPLALLAGMTPVEKPILEAPEKAPILAAQPAQDEEEAPPMNVWNGSVTAGGGFQEGNTETRSASVGIDATYLREKDRFSWGAFLNFAETKTTGTTQITERKYGATAQYDYFFNDRTYGLITGLYTHDDLANLDARYTVGVGVGHQFVDEDEFKLSGEAGLNYYREEFDPTPETDYIAARLAYDLYYKINENMEFMQSGEAYPSLEDSEDIFTRLDSRLNITMTERMFAQLQWVWDWDNTPAPGQERSDHRVLANVGWSF